MTAAMGATTKRHPIRGLFGGLCLGLGLAIMLVIYGKVAFGTWTPYLVIIAGVVIGVLWAFVAPARGPTLAAPASATTAPPAAETPPSIDVPPVEQPDTPPVDEMPPVDETPPADDTPPPS